MKVEMQHTEKTIRRLARVQYDTYCLTQKLVTALFAIILLVLGAWNCFDGTTSLVLVALGCFTITGINTPADRNAKKMIEYAKGDFPASEYQFRDNAVQISGDGQQTLLNYTDIYSLICDGPYLYLFISKHSAYMIPLESLGTQKAAELKAMLSEKTGLRVEKPGNLLAINLGSLRRCFTDPKKNQKGGKTA